MKKIDDAYEGEWWLPAEPDRKVGGILDLGDSFKLRFWGSLEDENLPPLRQTFDPSILHGRSISDRLSLLGGGNMSSRASSSGATVIGLHIPLVFVGSYLLESAEEAKFDHVQAGLGNLVDWVNWNPIAASQPADDTYSLEYKQISSPVAELPGASLKILHDVNHKRSDHAIQWEQTAELYFELANPEEIREIEYKFIRPFRYFLDLATGATSRPGPLQVANPAHLDQEWMEWLGVCAYGRNWKGRKSKSAHALEMPFTLQDINFATLLPRWYELVELMGITCDLIFATSAQEHMFVSNKMFNLASAAEGVHQRLYPTSSKAAKERKNRATEIAETIPDEHRELVKKALLFLPDMTFADRLRQLIEHAGPAIDPFVGDRDKWIKLVKDIRNQIAHAPRGRHSFESDARKLARLTATIDVLLRVVLLRELGFTDEECAKMTDKNPHWEYLKRILPQDVPEMF